VAAQRPGPATSRPALPARLTAVEPVFAEPTGRRWRVVQAGAVLVLGVLVTLLLVQLWPVIQLIRTDPAGPAPEALASRIGPTPVVFGSGPLVRLVAAHDANVTDPFTGAALGSLTEGDRQSVGTRPFAVQRYGYGAGTHQLVLTFDDGPDPAWTPKLLDILAKHHVRATFFVTGRASVTNPDLVRRIVREGHALGNHSLSHADLSAAPAWRARLELAGNQHLLEALSGQQVLFARPPYDGGAQGSAAEELLAIARAQQLGYAVASYDVDTHDWVYGGGTGDSAALIGVLPKQIPLPPLDGRNITLLMHDAGGDRSRTLSYVDTVLLPAAEAAGYTFATVPQANPGLVTPGTHVARPDSPLNRAMYQLAVVWLVLPNRMIGYLFVFAVVSAAATTGVYTVLALVRWRRGTPFLQRDGEPLGVCVVIAAYNEERVIEATLRSLVASTYPIREFIVVDDGSADRTAEVVASLRETLDPRIRLIRQPNGKKPAALNNAMRQTDCEIVVTVDADTHVDPDMVTNLVRHFDSDPFQTLGAVAGVVRVGNRTENLLTRWQALEYLNQIGVERAAHDLMGAIAIVPGACAAWRREAVLRAGGFSPSTLAEDSDLTLALHRMGWQVTQDDEARADTEAPEDVDSLLKQRVRWTYGSLQAIAKHRDMVLRPRFGWLGMLVMPWNFVSLLLPFVTIPFVAVMSVMAFSAQGFAVLGGTYLLFTAVQALTSAVAIWLLRERLSQLLMVPAYRLVYEPLRAYLLYKTGYLALRGVPVGWNKLTRTGSVGRPSAATTAAATAAEAAAARTAAADGADKPSVPPLAALAGIPRQTARGNDDQTPADETPSEALR